MPTLDWIGKQAVVGYHHRVPYRLLHCVRELSVGDPDAGNLLVEGDNLEALKALLPYYAGQVHCIYIDPPYNTGNEGWIYNDNVNSPEIRRWLGKAVGKEAEDLSRHDKWLCMMYPRLFLLKHFLRQDGAIFVSIDDNEVAHCRLLLEEVFGARNFITNIVWWKRSSPANDALHFSSDHDHILVFAKNAELWRPNRLAHTLEQMKNYTNPDHDPRGPWNSGAYTCAKTSNERPNLYYPITQPTTGTEVWPSPKRVWAYDQQSHQKNVEMGLVYWGKDGLATKPRIKKFLTAARPVVPRSIWLSSDAGHNQEAKTEALSIIPQEHYFTTPKPLRLLKRILEVSTDGTSLVLDSFAGSGTTGHALLKANSRDNGSRRFILIEMDESIATKVAAERLGKAIMGYHPRGDTSSDRIEPLGSGFRYCRLGKALFDETGSIADDVAFTDLAAHVFFAETGSPIPKRARKDNPLLGTFEGRAIYLLFNGVLGDKRPAGGNVLTHDVAQQLPSHPEGSGPRIVFAEACRLGDKALAHYGITFRQLPFELKAG